ncbi:MAG: SPOR domain-containing protein, partial [Cyanobacteria bacterium]|nr:SPOR domain-containing protein [Cyanobacteriota bacterium]
APPRSAPAPAAAAPAPATTPAPVAASTYYVVTNYTGDPSLNQARQVVGDAYVRNFPIGARIQLGAFSSEADAAAHADNLAAQGISAEVYNP